MSVLNQIGSKTHVRTPALCPDEASEDCMVAYEETQMLCTQTAHALAHDSPKSTQKALYDYIMDEIIYKANVFRNHMVKCHALGLTQCSCRCTLKASGLMCSPIFELSKIRTLTNTRMHVRYGYEQTKQILD